MVLFSVILSWSDFVFSLILITTDELNTLPYGLAPIDDTYDANQGDCRAFSTIQTGRVGDCPADEEMRNGTHDLSFLTQSAPTVPTRTGQELRQLQAPTRQGR